MKDLIFIGLILIGLTCINGHTGKKTKCLTTPTLPAKVEKHIKFCQDEVKTNMIEDVLLASSDDHPPYEGDSTEYGLHNFQQEPESHKESYSVEHNQPEHPKYAQEFSPFDETDHKYSNVNYDHSSQSYDTEAPEDEEYFKWNQRIATRRARRARRARRTKRGAFWDRSEYHPTIVSHEDKWVAGCLMQCVYRKANAVDMYGWPTLDGLVDLYTEGVNEQAYFMATLKGVDKCLKGVSVKHSITRKTIPSKGETCEVAFDVFDCVSDSITQYCSNH